MSGLPVASTLELPVSAATTRFAILAQPGAGKSNAAVVLAEAMYDAGIPWVAIDPKGDWWGVRSSRDGSAPGLAVPIFGGLHADVPIDSGAGKALAEVVAQQRLSCVIDTSQFDSNQATWGFLRDFASTLLRLNSEPLHVFADEADQFIPQKPNEKGNQLGCLNAWSRLVRLGRNKGIGVTLISQRSAVLNKDVLYMIDCLVAMRVWAKTDAETIRGWLRYSGGHDEIMSTLPTLEPGEAWLYAPAWTIKDPTRIRFFQRRTYDSGRTPEVGQNNTVPATLADIDLAVLGTRLTEAAERAKADDPRVLRARIAELERQARNVTDEVAVRRLTDERDEARGSAADLRNIVDRQMRIIGNALAILRENGELAAEIQAALTAASEGKIARPPEQARVTPIRRPVAPVPTTERSSSDGATLTKAERAVLTALAQYPQGRSMPQIALLTGYRQSGGFRNTLSALRTAGRIEGANGSTMTITDDGLRALGSYDALPVGRDLLDFWLSDQRMGKAHRAVLQAAYDAYPRTLSVDEAAQDTGYQMSGGFRNVLSWLRTSELIEGPNSGFTASPLFFEAVAR